MNERKLKEIQDLFRLRYEVELLKLNNGKSKLKRLVLARSNLEDLSFEESQIDGAVSSYKMSGQSILWESWKAYRSSKISSAYADAIVSVRKQELKASFEFFKMTAVNSIVRKT